MSDFRERYNHYMEMYKIVPPPEIDRRTSWTDSTLFHQPFNDNYGRHRESTGSVELCNQVDNLMHQFHNAKIMLSQSQLYNLERADYQYHGNYHAKSMQHHKSHLKDKRKHGESKYHSNRNSHKHEVLKDDSYDHRYFTKEISLNKHSHQNQKNNHEKVTKYEVPCLQSQEVMPNKAAIHQHLSNSSEPHMSSEFRQTLERWRSATRQFRQSSHKEQAIKNSFHHHIAMNWDHLGYSSIHEDDSQLDEKRYKNDPEYGKGIQYCIYIL